MENEKNTELNAQTKLKEANQNKKQSYNKIITIKNYSLDINLIVSVFLIIADILIILFGNIPLYKIIFALVMMTYYPLQSINKFLQESKGYIRFSADKIEYIVKNEIVRKTIYLKDIKEIKRTIGPSFPEIKFSRTITAIFTFISFIFGPIFVWVVVEHKNGLYILLIYIYVLILIFSPLILYRIINGIRVFDIFFDSILVYDKNGKTIETICATNAQYLELRMYFLMNLKKNIDKIEPKFFIY